MKATPVKAHQIASLEAARSSDGRFGLIRFVREVPLPDGTTDVWVAVPTNLLPYLATGAVKALPQPKEGTVPNLLDARGVALGVGPGGELVLSVTLEKGATLSYRIDTGHAESLLARLSDALGKSGANGKQSANGKLGANGTRKAKPPAKPRDRSN